MIKDLKCGLPTFVGLVPCHGLRSIKSRFSKVFLIYDTVFTNDKGHDSGISILYRIRNHREAACHFSVRDVVSCAAFCFCSLLVQNPKKVASERLGFVSRIGVTQSLGKIAQVRSMDFSSAFPGLPSTARSAFLRRL